MATTKNIQSVERVFSILELFQKNIEELSLKEIALSLELSKSTTFGLVNTLANLGYLQQNEENQKYSLGLKVLSLTNAIKTNNIIIRTMRPFLQELCDIYKETVHSAITSNGSVVYLDKVEADTSIYINTQMGTKNYMHCTGVGKCIMAYMSNDEQEKILQGHLKTMTYNTITNVELLREELSKIRKQGYSVDNEEIEIGLTCIAVPVFSDYHKVNLAISISGPTPRILDKNNNHLIDSLKATSKEISKILYSYDNIN